jgi:hypothetical protein
MDNCEEIGSGRNNIFHPIYFNKSDDNLFQLKKNSPIIRLLTKVSYRHQSTYNKLIHNTILHIKNYHWAFYPLKVRFFAQW